MKLYALQHWLFRTLAPDWHHDYLRLAQEHDDAYQMLKSSRSYAMQDRARARHLWRERAELTEVIASLVAKDDDGHWTTVFPADTRLPDAYQVQLNVLVNQA